jgi:hypothetical protein
MHVRMLINFLDFLKIYPKRLENFIILFKYFFSLNY